MLNILGVKCELLLSLLEEDVEIFLELLLEVRFIVPGLLQELQVQRLLLGFPFLLPMCSLCRAVPFLLVSVELLNRPEHECPDIAQLTPYVIAECSWNTAEAELPEVLPDCVGITSLVLRVTKVVEDVPRKLTALAVHVLVALEGLLAAAIGGQVDWGVLRLQDVLGVVGERFIRELLPFPEVPDERGHLLRHLRRVVVEEAVAKLIVGPQLITSSVYRILQLLDIDPLVLE